MSVIHGRFPKAPDQRHEKELTYAEAVQESGVRELAHIKGMLIEYQKLFESNWPHLLSGSRKQIHDALFRQLEVRMRQHHENVRCELDKFVDDFLAKRPK